MHSPQSARIVNLLIASVWLANGLFCKLLNFVPRHQLIVARILGADHAGLLTKTIGALEICMAVWVASRFWHRLCTWTQVALVAVMNVVEFTVAPDLLLFGRMNIAVAAVFIAVLVANERLYNRRQSAATFNG